MEALYISLVGILLGAILYKITDSTKIKYIGYSLWWGGWGFWVAWIISESLDIQLTTFLGLIVIISGWIVIEILNTVKKYFSK
ncbi:hypothetical protein [Paenibacillus silvisoli]|uniref:hypothetical protein n=1 Tax=Paenibacillus silvisoli TaxID=3110539 RepID=UPI002804A0E2|nr:hypothetical protein [Paenibacillus silvisoli]